MRANHAGVVTRLLLPLLLLAACAAPAKGPARLVVAPELAEPTLAAVDLWQRATDGAYSPEVVISDECGGTSAWCITAVDDLGDSCPDATVPDPSRQHSPRACTRYSTRRTLVARTMDPAEHVSTIAHELGHQLGLVHVADPVDDLMSIDRSRAVRLAPCVSADDAESAGFVGAPGACVIEEASFQCTTQDSLSYVWVFSTSLASTVLLYG